MVGHKKQWEFLENKFKANQISHAYLFTGEEGIGKKLFAKEFAESINCKFPDLKIIEAASAEGSGEPKKDISIAKIREVQSFLSYKAYNGNFKIVIIDNAHLMNAEAQNCFLKTLEEPKGNTILFLISSKPDLLLPTIFSRCQVMKFFKPKNLPENLEKLEREKNILKEILPVLNSSLAEKFKYTKNLDFEKQNATEIISVLQKYFREKLLNNLSDKKFLNILKFSEEIYSKLLFTNANPKLALEILLMEI